ncbi:hypothetical protein ACFYRD_34265 [Streptomyces hirsutus]|uniref:hypothetical protein n=1 Tax=Streptomyces hirsutus TaxID=35620 RepID=UPI0036AC27DB
MGLLEERERVALARAEELRVELERLQVAVVEAEEAARRAVIAREELVDALSGVPAQVTEAAAGEAVVVGGEAVVVGGGAGRKAEVPVWAEGLERSVLPEEYARIVFLVERDGAGGGGGVRARGLRDGLGWQATDAREQAARFRAKRLVERGWLVEAGPGLFRPGPGRSA